MRYDLDAPSGYIFERLDSKRHDRASFDCGEEPLNDFLRTKASQQNSRETGITHVLIKLPSENESFPVPIIGFITTVTRQEPLLDRKREYEVCLLLLGRLALQREYQGNGEKLGGALLKAALGLAVSLSDYVGCSSVVVDAKHDKAKSFYEYYGFNSFPEDPYRLSMPIATARQLISN